MRRYLVVLWRAAPTSPLFAEIEERHKADWMAGPDAELEREDAWAPAGRA